MDPKRFPNLSAILAVNGPVCLFCQAHDWEPNHTSGEHECQDCGHEYTDAEFAKLKAGTLTRKEYDLEHKPTSALAEVLAGADDVTFNPEEKELLRLAVSFLKANISAAEDALDIAIDPAKVEALEGKLYAPIK
jgi:hypothetical protein